MASSSSGSSYRRASSSSTKSADTLADSLGGLVIGVSGKIPGRKHDDIRREVESYGATFEDGRTSTDSTTHLITTPSSMYTEKVQQARAKKACDIVSIDWLIKSIENLEPLDTKDFLVKLPDNESAETETSTAGARASKKRKHDSEPDSERVSPAKKSRAVPSNEDEKWAALVDEDFRVPQKFTVWHDDGGIWDATLVKEYTSEGQSPPPIETSFYRIQLLLDVEAKEYYTHIRRDASEQQKRHEVKGTGDLETAKREFRKSFKNATGLQWEKRTDAPQENREIFVACSYKDEVGDGASAAQSQSASSAGVLPNPVQDVLRMLLNADQKPAIRDLLNTVSTGRLKVNRDRVTNHTVRVGTALLDMLCKLPRNSNGELNADDSRLAERLTRCYVGLMFNHKSSVPTDADWIEKERETLRFMRNLIWVQKLLDKSPSPIASKDLSMAHRKLSFPMMTPVARDTNEYKLLDKYFQSSISVSHSNGVVKYKETPGKVFNIFRIERSGEEDQLEKWTAANEAKAGERRLLWHGSPTANFIGILTQGLRPSVFPSNGSSYMFGNNGICLADEVGNSMRSCRAKPGEMALMLLCEVEVGHTMKPYSDAPFTADADFKASNSCAVFGQGSTFCDDWCDAECLHPDLEGIMMSDVDAGKSFDSDSALAHNEYVVYDPAQVRQRYLVQFQMP